MNVFTVLLTVLGVVCLVKPYRFVIYLMICSCVLGSTAAILAGNTSVLAANFTLLFLIVRTFFKLGPSGFLTPFHPASPGFILLMFGGFGLVTAFLSPRLFAGSTQVFNLVDVRGVALWQMVPLRFGSGNINQAIYLIGNISAFACAFSLARLPGAYEVFVKAIIAVAIINIVMALIDLATWATGTSVLLSFMKTAKLAFLDDDEIGGLKRISGSFAETSAFSGFTLRLFGICFSLWMSNVRTRLTGWLSAIMFMLLVMSTSSTAYIGLSFVVPVVMARNLWSIFAGRASARGMIRLLVIGVAGMVAIALVVLFAPAIADTVARLADTLLFNKLETDSGHERSAWNAQGLQNLLDTYGLGVGLGSTRASSSIVVLLSNVGLVGTILYMVFVYQCLRPRPNADATGFDRAFILACRIGLLTTMSAQLVSGTVIDIGIFNAMLFGICAADVFTGRVQQATLRWNRWDRSVFRRPEIMNSRPAMQ